MRLQGKLSWMIFAGICGLCAILAADAKAQFSQTPSNLPAFQGNTGQSNSTMSSSDVQRLYLLRYLQGRSGGGVKRGAPQFIPFGNQMFMGGGMMPMQGPSQMQNTFPTNTPTAGSGKKSLEERKAEAQAAREERKRKALERAEKRKQEAAARRAAASN